MWKKFEKYSLLILILILLVLVSDFRKAGFYQSHDGDYHLVRLIEYDEALKSGQFPPRWSSHLLYGFGYPLFVYSYHLPFISMEIFHLLGFSPVDSLKIVLAFSFVLSGIFSYFFLKKFFGATPAFAGALFYTIAPFRFADLYIRASVGEHLSFVFLPLVFLSFTPGFNIFLGAVSLAGLILSHTLVALMVLPVVLLYAIFISGNEPQKWRKIFFMFVFGLSLSAFQLFPQIFEKKFIRADEAYLSIYKDAFLPLGQLLRIPFTGVNIGTPFQAGIAHILVAFLVILYLRQKKFAERKPAVFFLFILAISLFLTTGLSKIFWDNFVYLKYLIFPWRFLVLIVLASSVLAGILVNHCQNRVFFVFLVFLLFYANRHYFRPPNFSPVDAGLLRQKVITGTTENEFMPKEADISPDSSRDIEIIGGDGLLKDAKRNFHWEVEFLAKTSAKLQFPVLNFAGWKASVNGKPAVIENINGLIVIPVEKGKNLIQLKFVETRIRTLGNLSSLTAFFLIFLYLAIRMLSMEIFKKTARIWKEISRKVGMFQSKMFLTGFYFFVFTPFALIFKLFADPLNLKTRKKSFWLDKNTRNVSTLGKLRKQY